MKGKKDDNRKMAPVDRQIFRIGQFRHRNSLQRSVGATRPFDYLSPSESAALEIAFKGFGLDANDPAQRDYLLAVLAYGIFGEEGEPGGPGRPRGSRSWNAARKLDLINQINSAIKAIVEETGRMPRTRWEIVEKISPGRGRDENGNLYNRVRELYQLQANKKK